MSTDSAANFRAMDALLRAGRRLGSTTPRTEVPGWVVVRVDNPWHAEDWRRKQMTGRPGWLFDAASMREIAGR